MRIRHILIGYLFLISTNGFAQNKSNDQWQKLEVDENLTVMFPKDLERIDTLVRKGNTGMKFKVFSAKTPYSKLGITVTAEETSTKIDNEEEMNEVYKGVETGFRNSVVSKGFSCSFSDAIVDRIVGRKALLYKKGSENFPSAVFYLFILNAKLYEIGCSSINGSVKEMEDCAKLIAGLDFTAVEIRERKFGSKEESRGYKIGELIGEIIGFLGIIGLIVGLIIFITKRK